MICWSTNELDNYAMLTVCGHLRGHVRSKIYSGCNVSMRVDLLVLDKDKNKDKDTLLPSDHLQQYKEYNNMLKCGKTFKQ